MIYDYRWTTIKAFFLLAIVAVMYKWPVKKRVTVMDKKQAANVELKKREDIYSNAAFAYGDLFTKNAIAYDEAEKRNAIDSMYYYYYELTRFSDSSNKYIGLYDKCHESRIKNK